MAAKAYEVVVGLNYPPHGRGAAVRANPGDVVTNLPQSAIAELLEQGVIRELVEDGD